VLPVGAGRPTGDELSPSDDRGGDRQVDLAPESMTLSHIGGPSNTTLLVVHANVKGYVEKMRVLIDSGASSNYARRASLNTNKEVLGSAERTHVSDRIAVRLATGTVVETQRIEVDLRLRFFDFDSVERFIALDLDERYDLILGMPWLVKHEPWIDWKSKSIGASKPAVSDRVAVSHVPGAARWHSQEWREQRLDKVSPFEVGVSEIVEISPEQKTGADVDNVAAEVSPMWARKESVRWAPLHPHDPTGRLKNEVPGQDRPGQPEGDHVGQAGRDHDPVTDATSDNACHERRSSVSTDATALDGLLTGDSLGNDTHVSEAHQEYRLLDGVTGAMVAPSVQLAPLPEQNALVELDEMSVSDFAQALAGGEVAEVVVIRPTVETTELNSSSVMDASVIGEIKEHVNARRGSAILRNPKDPFYSLLKEYGDVVLEEPPTQLPPDRGVRHEIDLIPGTKYCVTRQWPLPREQCEVIDDFFRAKHEAGMVRESKSPHSTPTFCVRKPNGKWRIVHAFNKLNAATIPAQTPIPRKEVLQNNMAGSTMFSALDLVDGYYQILMREEDVPLTAVSTPSGMLWEWLVMPQGLSNAPATFNRLVTQLFRPLRAFAQTYFDDIFVHSKSEHGMSEMDVHREHLRQVLECMREHKLYANIDKCVFGAEEIPFLGCYIGKRGIRADPGKVKAIVEWPVPRNQKDLRKWLGLANYLHKYSANYAEMARPLTLLLKKDAEWQWTQIHEAAFTQVKASLLEAPVLALPDPDRPFSVVCDASDFAIGCALLQADDEGRERVIAFESRQLKAAEKNYPVHDKELLAMKYALVKFRVHLLGERAFVVYTDHASLRTATSSPHLSQRMARWLSFFAEYNFRVEYKPGKQNVLADALSRRPDYELAHVTSVTVSLLDQIRAAYAHDESCRALIAHFKAEADASEKAGALSRRLRARIHRYSLAEGLLYYSTDLSDPPRVVVPLHDDLRFRILYEAHDLPLGGHLGREKTHHAVSVSYWWPHLYKWVASYVRTCETCQRVKVAPSAAAPLASLPVPTECWQSISLDFVFGLPKDGRGNTGVLVFVCRLSKMVHLAPCSENIDAAGSATLFLEHVFKAHGLPETIVSDRDPRFVARFWSELFRRLGTRLTMSTSDHPQTDGQTERVNRVLEDILRSTCAESPKSWSSMLPFVEFAMNNAVHASTGCTPFFVNGLRHPRVPMTLSLGPRGAATLGGGEARSGATAPTSQSDTLARSLHTQLNEFMSERLSVIRRVRDAMASAQDTQKEHSDRVGRKNTNVFEIGDLVLLNARNLPLQAVSAVEKTKLRPRYVGPFKVLARKGKAYRLQLPSAMKTHPVFYVGLLKPYHDPSRMIPPRDPALTPPSGVPQREPTARVEMTQAHRPVHLEKTTPKESGSDTPRERARPAGLGSPSDYANDHDGRRTSHGAHGTGHTGRTTRMSSPEAGQAGTLAGSPAGSPAGNPANSLASSSEDTSPKSDEPQAPQTSGPAAVRPSRSESTLGPEGRPRVAVVPRPSGHEQQALHDASKEDHRSSGRGSSGGGTADQSHDRAQPVSLAGPARPPPALLDPQGRKHYLVEALVQKRLRRGMRQFLVKWRGYPHSQNSWEPESVLREDCPDLVRAFDSARASRPSGHRLSSA